MSDKLWDLIHELIITEESARHACGCESCKKIPAKIKCLISKINDLWVEKQ